MKKIYVLLAIAIVGIFMYSTAVYIPEGYTAVTRDGESIYTEGMHPFQKYPFENIQMIKLSEQCELYSPNVKLNDGPIVSTKINVCWKITKDAKKIKDLKTLYNHGNDYISYEQNIIRPSLFSNTYKVFYGFNSSTLEPFDLNLNQTILEINQDILDRERAELSGKGIEITKIEISLPGFETFRDAVTDAIKKRNEIKKQAENEAKRIQEEVSRQYS